MGLKVISPDRDVVKTQCVNIGLNHMKLKNQLSLICKNGIFIWFDLEVLGTMLKGGAVCLCSLPYTKCIFMSESLIPMHEAIFGNRVFADVINLRPVILDYHGT